MTAESTVPPQPAPVAVGLIGVSGYARVYLRLAREFQEQGWLTLAAATIINPGEEATIVSELQAAGTRVYGCHREMLAREQGKLQACLIPTGIPWHARMTVAALEAGLDVLVEKPLAGCLADAQLVRAAERTTGRFVAVGFQDLYADATETLKQQLCDGLIGQLQSARVIGVWPRDAAYYQRNVWSGRLQAQQAAVNDSPLQNGLAHFVHLALFLTGAQPREAARAELLDAELWRAHPIESFDTAVTRARTPAGVQLWFGVSHAASERRDVLLRLEGTGGTVEWHHEGRQVTIRRDGHVESRTLPPLLETRRSMLAKFLRRRQDSGQLIADSAMAEHHVRFIDDLHRLTPIRAVPAPWLETVRHEGKVFTNIRGINTALESAFACGSRLSDLGFMDETPIRPVGREA